MAAAWKGVSKTWNIGFASAVPAGGWWCRILRDGHTSTHAENRAQFVAGFDGAIRVAVERDSGSPTAHAGKRGAVIPRGDVVRAFENFRSGCRAKTFALGEPFAT